MRIGIGGCVDGCVGGCGEFGCGFVIGVGVGSGGVGFVGFFRLSGIIVICLFGCGLVVVISSFCLSRSLVGISCACTTLLLSTFVSASSCIVLFAIHAVLFVIDAVAGLVPY